MRSNWNHAFYVVRRCAFFVSESSLFLSMKGNKSREVPGRNAGTRSNNGAFLSSQLMHHQSLTPDDEDDLLSNSFDSPACLSMPATRSAVADESELNDRTQTQCPRKENAPVPKRTLQKKRQSTKKQGRGCGKQSAASVAKGRGLGFSKAELDCLLELLEEHLPIGQIEWEAVLSKHTERFPTVDRSVESLRRQFASLYFKNVPIGDPNIPREVERSKAVRLRIIAHADIGDDADLDDCVDDAFENGDNAGDLLPREEDISEDREDRVEIQQSAVSQNSQVASRKISNSGELASPRTNSRSPGSYTPRPLISIGKKKRKREGSDNDLITIIKMNILQEQQLRQDDIKRRQVQREEEQRQREEDRRRRQDERAEERARGAKLKKKA